MAHTFSDLLVHIIFGTKDRFPLIDQDLRRELHAYIGGIVKNLGGMPLSIGGVADHVHMLVELKPKIAVSDAVEKIKANSTNWVHRFGGMRRKFAWQKGYSAFSVSRSSVERVRRYIEKQEQHHRRITFQEEYVRFLKEYGIPYEERYLFE
jgi:REP element-mobilizing transposase RayT